MEYEDARAAFVSVMEAEERLKLMTTLLDEKVGTPDVENFFRKQLQHCRVGFNRTKRNEKQIRLSMLRKFKDAVADLKFLKKKKYQVIQRLVSDNSKSTSRRVIRTLQSEVRKARKQVRIKNEKKVKHLVNKFRQDCQVPPRLSRYSQAKVFTSDEMEADKNPGTKPLVYGGVRIDDDEAAAVGFGKFDTMKTVGHGNLRLWALLRQLAN